MWVTTVYPKFHLFGVVQDMAELRKEEIVEKFVESPIFQEKIYFYESLDEDNQDNLTNYIEQLIARPNIPEDFGKFLKWHLDIIEHLSNKIDIQQVKDEGIKSGYISDTKNIYDTIFSALDRCEMFCETQALFKFHDIASSIRRAWIADQITTGPEPISFDLGKPEEQPDDSQSIAQSVFQTKNDLALLQTVGPLTTIDALEMVLVFECKRLTRNNQPVAGLALLFFGAVLLASQSPQLAQRLLLEARSRCSKESGLDLEYAAILGLLFQISSNEDQRSFGTEIQVLCQTELEKRDAGGPDPRTMRKLASSLIEVTINLQDQGQQEAANKNYNTIVELFESASSLHAAGDDPNTMLDWATAYMNRGNVKRALEPPEIEAALIDYKTGISMKERLLDVIDLPSFFAEQIRGDLEKGYSNVAAAEQQLKQAQRHGATLEADEVEQKKSLKDRLHESRHIRPKEAGYDALSRVIESLSDDDRGSLNSDQKFMLATQFVQRGRISFLQQSNARMHKPTPSWADAALDEAFNDFDKAIRLLGELKDENQYSADLIAQEYGRVHALRSASYEYTLDQEKHERALEDIEVAINSWISIEDYCEEYFDACSQKCKILVELDRRDEALAMATSSLDLRSTILTSDSHQSNKETFGGTELANIAAFLLSTSERVAEALVLLAKNTALLSQLHDREAPIYDRQFCFEDIQKLAPKDGAVVVSVVLDQATSVLIFTDKGEVGHIEFGYWIANNAKIMLVMSAMDMVTDAPELRWAGIERSAVIAAEGFWRYYVEPVWQALEREFKLPLSAPVTFVTQDALDYAPLHAAARETDGNWRFAIEDRVIRYAPSLYALNLMKGKKAQSKANHVFGFFDPMGDLPTSRYLETNCIKESVGSEQLHTYIGEAASKTKLLELLRANDGEPFSLHFSTHCENVTFDQSSSFIVLSDLDTGDGRITTKQLDNLPRLSLLRHVSLASCQSGFPDIGRFASDPRGLAAAFVNLGAESVLTSIYPLLDTPTTELVTGMYRRQKEGSDVAEALRAEICERLAAARAADTNVFSLNGPAPSSQVDDHGMRKAVTALTQGEPVVLTSWWAGLKPICSG